MGSLFLGCPLPATTTTTTIVPTTTTTTTAAPTTTTTTLPITTTTTTLPPTTTTTTTTLAPTTTTTTIASVIIPFRVFNGGADLNVQLVIDGFPQTTSQLCSGGGTTVLTPSTNVAGKTSSTVVFNYNGYLAASSFLTVGVNSYSASSITASDITYNGVDLTAFGISTFIEVNITP
jgi:hypothetical protein